MWTLRRPSWFPRHARDPGTDAERAFWTSMSSPGLLVGTLLFAFSLTPSLLPRSAPMQGIVSGVSFAAGYGLGVLVEALWYYLELPVPRGRALRIVHGAAWAVCLVTAGLFLWKASDWQNSIRVLMDMPPVEGARPFTVGIVSALLFGAALAIARLFVLSYRILYRFLTRCVPTRESALLGLR